MRSAPVPSGGPISLVDHIAASRLGTLAMAGGAGVVVPLIATLSAPPAVDLALIAASVVSGAATVVLSWVRARVLSLPLELSEVACRGRYGAHPVYRFRVRLGRNRMMTAGTASVRFIGEGVDTAVALELAQIDACVGPWTLVVVDRDRVCTGPGRFTVTVDAYEGATAWHAEASYDTETMRSGRFGADAQMKGTTLVVDAGRWDTVLADDAA